MVLLVNSAQEKVIRTRTPAPPTVIAAGSATDDSYRSLAWIQMNYDRVNKGFIVGTTLAIAPSMALSKSAPVASTGCL